MLLSVVGYEVAVLEVGVVFDLVDRRRVHGGLQRRFEVVLEVVRDSDRFGLAARLDLLHVSPFLLEVLVALGEEGLVDQVEIDVVQSQLLQARVNCTGDVVEVRGDFGGDEEFVSGDLAGFDRSSELSLRIVHFGPVEMDVAKLKGFGRGVDQCLIKRGVGPILVPGGAGAVSELDEYQSLGLQMTETEMRQYCPVMQHYDALITIDSRTYHRYGMAVRQLHQGDLQVQTSHAGHEDDESGRLEEIETSRNGCEVIAVPLRQELI